jgi:rhodanese-related sulfurtransferase
MRLFGIRRGERAEPVPMISAGELKRRLDRGEHVVVLDVRQPSAYAEYPGAIPGSIRIPPAELPDRYGELPRGRLILSYCT